MSDKLSNLVDNLSIIYDMECKKKKKCIERKIRQNVNLSDSEMID